MKSLPETAQKACLQQNVKISARSEKVADGNSEGYLVMISRSSMAMFL